MKLSKILVISAISAVAFALPANAGWVDGGGKSCSAVCSSAGSAAVNSGTFQNGNPFTICAANAHGEGYRAGYNLEPSWSNACVVGYGGKEEKNSNYKCLCQTKPAG